MRPAQRLLLLLNGLDVGGASFLKNGSGFVSKRFKLTSRERRIFSAKEVAMAEGRLQANGNKGANKRGLKLLLVDEDAKDLDYYSEVLRYLGYEVRSVDSYAEAAASLGRERFDLVLVDQGSSDFEGRSVLTRAVEVDRRVPVLVLTRAVDADCCFEALDAGAYEYVQKPLTTSEVRELVSDYVKPSVETSSPNQDYVFHGNLAESNQLQAEHEPWRKAS